MILACRQYVLLLILICLNLLVYAAEPEQDSVSVIDEPIIGSWTFSGIVSNEGGDRYGYFFQIQRHGTQFHAKTALIDALTNSLVLYYDNAATIDQVNSLNWKVGRAFIRHNPINDSWIFGLKTEQDKGFNFRVDTLNQTKEDNEPVYLRPGIKLLAVQTSRLNGHMQIGDANKEEFVTGSNSWLGKIWVSDRQTLKHEINTTFCRLDNDNGFYAVNLKEADATGAAVAGWRDALGTSLKMSQFISVKPLKEDKCLLRLDYPKMQFKLLNTLTQEDKAPLYVAGFSRSKPNSFCYITQLSFSVLG